MTQSERNSPLKKKKTKKKKKKKKKKKTRWEKLVTFNVAFPRHGIGLLYEEMFVQIV